MEMEMGMEVDHEQNPQSEQNQTEIQGQAQVEAQSEEKMHSEVHSETGPMDGNQGNHENHGNDGNHGIEDTADHSMESMEKMANHDQAQQDQPVDRVQETEDTVMADHTQNEPVVHSETVQSAVSEPAEPSQAFQAMESGSGGQEVAEQQMAEPMDTDDAEMAEVSGDQMAESGNASHQSTGSELVDKEEMEMDHPQQAAPSNVDPEPEATTNTTTTTTMTTKPQTTSTLQHSSVAAELMECGRLLIEFMKRPETEPFNEPVDWKGLNLPDYPLIIRHQMDLGTVQSKLEGGKYGSADKFAEDIRLVFKNAMTYNTPGSGIYVVAENLFKQFERRFARITKMAPYKRRKNNNVERVGGEPSSYEERQQFTNLVQQLTPPELGGVVELIDKKSPQALNDHNDNEDELDIEVYNIDGQTLKELIQFIEKTISKRGSRKKKRGCY